ncbi:MAG: sensor histidine kinase [Bacteroidetes bacterium]|nr:MAG: sensor histidine kinase [Bacteroidota bacterium]REK08079.1 MAG: sensor histidine kinase [Bacteroidota bacterium]REK32284.1 MAG: sensor histidine kinase [Bacteroidota bacterium]REK49517.1 MAG: sensor histidine kinase [Bacteroidota bacterium]
MRLKNPTPRFLSFYAAVSVSLVGLILLLLFYFTDLKAESFSSLILIVVVLFTSSYLIFRFFLEFFIYRKIKLIYKTINTLQETKQHTSSLLEGKEDIIGNVNKEVMKWNEARSEEISILRKNEIFRKEFLGNVSHELKTPIFNIQGYIHTLLDGGIDDPEVNIHYLQRAAKSAERLCMIVEDLEQISNLESGDFKIEMRTFDIYDLAEDVLDSQDLYAGEKNIQLGFKDGLNKPVYVIGDKDRIREVLVNLVVNSIKYGKKGGSTKIGFYDMDEKILVEVTDTGIGISSEHLPRLFERFYRVDKGRSRDQGGSGLGLAIVKHIIEAHKQVIKVRSTLTEGSTFSFTLNKAD